MGTTNKRDKDINHCVWCGGVSPMEPMQLPQTPILEHMEEKIDNIGRKRIWGDNSDWSRIDMDSDLEAELLVYDEMLAMVSLKIVCERCIKEDERLWKKYYDNPDDMDVVFWDDEF